MSHQTVLEALGARKISSNYKKGVKKLESKLGVGEGILLAWVDLMKCTDTTSKKKGKDHLTVCCITTNNKILFEADKFSASYYLSEITEIDLDDHNFSIMFTGQKITAIVEKKNIQAVTNIHNFIVSQNSGISKLEARNELLSNAKMRTIDEISEYLETIGDTPAKRDIANFEYLLNNLYDDEHIHIAFSGLLEAETTDKRSTFVSDRESSSSRDTTNAAFALTNQRLIYARKTGIMGTVVMGGSYVKTVDLEEIRKVSSYSRLLLGTLVLETIMSTIRVQGEKNSIEKITDIVRRFVDEFRKKNKQPATVQVTQASQIDTAEELRKFKQLEIDGIISAEEFEAKKKDLMGL